MKFANYSFKARQENNLGDNLQTIAIDYLYQKMEIDSSQIVYINTQDLDTYCGEYVVLPVSMPLVDYREGGISKRFSNHILPVFLGYTTVKDTLSEQEVQYLKNYQPIGCRDERTLNTLRRYQIVSYLHGCITATLPLRQVTSSQHKVFIVDIAEELLPLIPENLKKGAEYRTHNIAKPLDNPKAAAAAQYTEYLEQAGLVITSLLHCAVPCMAAGIPVVMLKSKVSYRMAWLEKLLPIYTPENAQHIDWSPKPVHMEEHKQRVLDVSIERMRKRFQEYAPIFDLSLFYENRPKNTYINDACYSLERFVEKYWTDKQAPHSYAIWGLTQTSECLVEYIRAQYPNAQLRHVYDRFRKVVFKGIPSERPELIRERPEETVFVTAVGAREEAEMLFDEIQKKEGSYAFYEIIR